MKPAIFTSFNTKIPFAQVIPMLRQAGFQAVSFSAKPGQSDYRVAGERAAMAKVLAANGMAVDSLHAPFPEGDRLFSLVEAERLESIRQCQMAVDAAAELNGRIVVLHLIQPYRVPEGEVRTRMIEQGRRSVGVLAAYAAERGVKLALENGQTREYDDVLESLLAEFDTVHVGLCYDAGHENVQGTCFKLLKKYGHRLLTVHIHDNKGSDTHTLPYEGTIDWDKFCQVLHGLAYDGNLLLEVDMANSQFKGDAAFLDEAKRCAQKLLERPSAPQEK